MFIKALDEKKTWRFVLTGWMHPTTNDSNGKEVLRLEVSWSSEYDRLANYNSKALHAIFNGDNQIKLFAICKSTKNAWDILQTTYE